MPSPIDIFATGARDGVYPGGQLAASRECMRLVTASVGHLAPDLPETHNEVPYDLASLTKPLATTILIGRALEAGLCALDDPIGKFIPGVASEITIECLLNHSSGYVDHMRFDRTLPSDVPPGSWDAWRHIVFAAAHAPRQSAPGDAAIYSDIGFILLGAALEVMFSQPLSTAHGLLGTPLFYRDRRGPPALPFLRPPFPFAPTEGCEPGEVHDENARAMGGAAGHAGLFGTAEGVLKVAEHLVAVYHGWSDGILRPDTLRTLWRPSKVPGSTRTLGWDRPSQLGASTGGRWPIHSVGHLGFTGTSLWIEPERSLIVVLVTNRVCPTRANNMIRRLRPLLYDAAWSAWANARPRSRPPSNEAEAEPERMLSGPSANPTRVEPTEKTRTLVRDEQADTDVTPVFEPGASADADDTQDTEIPRAYVTPGPGDPTERIPVADNTEPSVPVLPPTEES